MIDWLVEDGRIALVAIAVLLAEVLVVALWQRATSTFIASAASGLALLGALYCALSGQGTLAVLLCLAMGLVAHLAWLRLSLDARR